MHCSWRINDTVLLKNYLFIVVLLLIIVFIYFVHARFSFTRCSTFILRSLFKRKRFNSDPGLYSRYFDPAVPVKPGYYHHLSESINIIHQTALTLS